jgi:hypothetical protein
MGDQRSRIEQALADCAAEHGGNCVGSPGYYLKETVFTVLTYNESSAWWRELADLIGQQAKSGFGRACSTAQAGTRLGERQGWQRERLSLAE